MRRNGASGKPGALQTLVTPLPLESGAGGELCAHAATWPGHRTAGAHPDKWP
jgi:hypothetical protein